jgi:hypothetical protein
MPQLPRFAGAYSRWIAQTVTFIEECAAFPNGAHDDQVDAMTQVILRWHTAPPQERVVLWSEILDPMNYEATARAAGFRDDRLPWVQISPF